MIVEGWYYQAAHIELGVEMCILCMVCHRCDTL